MLSRNSFTGGRFLTSADPGPVSPGEEVELEADSAGPGLAAPVLQGLGVGEARLAGQDDRVDQLRELLGLGDVVPVAGPEGEYQAGGPAGQPVGHDGLVERGRSLVGRRPGAV